MEYIERVLYRKINPSDFKKLYDIDKPQTGGGQTYLEAAGISNELIVDFLEYAEISDSPLKDERRKVYTFNAYVLGKSSQHDFIEFAPRAHRNNYRISRQNMKYKHPAWSVENDFPAPVLDNKGNNISDPEFKGIIDNLIILIIRTTYKKYYAGYCNSDEFPNNWPKGIGLEKIFEDKRRGVLNFSNRGLNLPFIDSLSCPFGTPQYITNEERIPGGVNVILYGVPGSGKSWTIEHEYCSPETIVERIVFHPDYTNADFIGQLMPVVDSDRQITYEFVPGPFTSILKEAYLNPSKKYILVIEEINRGNAASIFGEVFQLLDRSKTEKKIHNVIYPAGTSEYCITHRQMANEIYGDSTQKVRITSNLSIIGTMNTSDQNVFTLDTAFQRRWRMRLVENSFDNVASEFANMEILDTGVTWETFCETINNIIVNNNMFASSEDKRLGVFFVQKEDLVRSELISKKNIDVEKEKYKELIKKELDSTPDNAISSSEKEYIANFTDILKQDRIFPEKVIKYLWDDAFKFNHEDIFDDTINSLENAIDFFVFSRGINRFNIFKEQIRKQF